MADEPGDGRGDGGGTLGLKEGSCDAVLLLDLAPGSYTVQVAGVRDATGVALVEVYEVGP